MPHYLVVKMLLTPKCLKSILIFAKGSELLQKCSVEPAPPPQSEGREITDQT